MFRLLNLILIAFCLTQISFALPEDNKQTVHIICDATTYDYRTGTTTYEGHVKLDQGTTHLLADKLVTTKDNKHRIANAIAYGINQLAEYTTLPNKGDPIMHAKAKTIEYSTKNTLVTLTGNVIVTQGDNRFHGPVLIYDMKQQTVTAPASKVGKSIILISPGSLS